MKKKFNVDRITYCLINVWLSLPLVVILKQLKEVLSGNFPTKSQILMAGYEIGKVIYGYTAEFYVFAFRFIGVISIAWTLYLIFIKRKNFFNKVSKWNYLLIGLLVWAFVSMMMSDDPSFAFIGDIYLCDGYSSYLIYASVFVLSSSLQTEEYRIKIIKHFIYLITLLASIMIVQNMHKIEFLDFLFPTYRATIFNHYNHFAYLLCMVVSGSLCLYLYDKKDTYLATFIICYIALLINSTLGCWIAVIIALPIIGFVHLKLTKKELKYKSGLILAFVTLILVSFVVAPSLRQKIFGLNGDISNIVNQTFESKDAGNGRMLLWRETIAKIKKRPIFGFGPLGLSGANSITMEDSPHNEFLQIAAFLGIPGLVLYLSSLITIFKSRLMSLKKLPTSCVVAIGVVITYLISSLFGNPIFNTYPYFWMFVGLSSININD